ncbi:MAG: TatD family hydrolase, partial [Candidatus Lokiarchaeota archaeon]|nr:TatD family hydrolase [Candidatus Lokiarchaeota archaeon]
MPKKINIPEPEENLRIIDVHCHLPFPRPKNNDRLPSDEQQYRDFLDKGGVYLVTSSIDIVTLNLILTFVKDKEKIGFTCGWAPQTVTYSPKDQYNREWEKWIDFIKNNQDMYLAIGEIGLDFHHAKT